MSYTPKYGADEVFVGPDAPTDPLLELWVDTDAISPTLAAGHVVQDEGVALTARSGLNFVGPGVTATDDAANNRTTVTVPGDGGEGSVEEVFIGPDAPIDALTELWVDTDAVSPTLPAGPQGPQGPQGPAGATGSQGPQGATGAQGPKGDTGAQGTAGAPGEKWFSGAGAPSTATGVVGDWYIDSTNGDYHEKTGSTTWTLRGNLKGPTGPAGGVTDHGALTGLADDDHPQYVKDTGDTVTGPLYVTGEAGTAGVHLNNATSKAGLASYSNDAAIISSDALTFRPLYILDPIQPNHAASKNYVDVTHVIPFGYMTFSSRSTAANWNQVLTPNSQFLAGGMTISNSAFVVPTTGRYMLTYTLTWGIAGTSCGAGIGINGALTSEGICYQEGFSNLAFTFTGSALLSRPAGGTFSLFSYQTGGGNITDAYFYIARIGA